MEGSGSIEWLLSIELVTLLNGAVSLSWVEIKVRVSPHHPRAFLPHLAGLLLRNVSDMGGHRQGLKKACGDAKVASRNLEKI